jgi:hypothetical protein
LMNRSCIAIRIRFTSGLLNLSWRYGPGFGDRGRASQIGTIYILISYTSRVLPQLKDLDKVLQYYRDYYSINQNPPWENPEEADEKVWRLLWSYQLSDGWVLQRTTVPVLCGLKGYWKRLVMSIVGMSMVWSFGSRIWNVFDGIQGTCVKELPLPIPKVSYPTCLNVQELWTWLLHDVCISTCFHPKAERTIYRYSSFCNAWSWLLCSILHNVGHDFFCICLQLYVMLCGDSRWICVSGAVMDVSMLSPGELGKGSAAEESGSAGFCSCPTSWPTQGDGEKVMMKSQGRLKAKRMNLNHLR